MLKTNKKGFTMVELLIVLAIIAILAAVAIPVYSSQLENSRIEVDNSNLRAATGLAAQDYILRAPTTLGIGDPSWHYLVFSFEKTGNDAVKSQNMVVYPDNGVIDDEGNWYANAHTKINKTGKVELLPGRSKALEISGWVTTNNHKMTIKKVGTNPKVLGQTPTMYPLQQNGGNARFYIKIGPGGVVEKSEILLGKDMKINII